MDNINMDDIRANPAYMREALAEAIKEGNLELVKVLEGDGDATYETGTFLHLACENGKTEIVEHFLDKGANINRAYDDEERYAALHLATENEDINMVTLLLTRNVNVNAEGGDGTTALHIACASFNVTPVLKIAKVLLNHGAHINSMCTYKGEKGCTPLYLAARIGSTRIINLLLTRGANANIKRENVETALHIASESGYKDIVEDLLEHGANVNCMYTSTIRKGCTPLHLAVDKDNEDVMMLLLNNGANMYINAEGQDHRTAVQIANNNGCKTCIRIFKNHTIKMKTAYSYINNKHIPFEIDNKSVEDEDFWIECKEQITIMKDERFNNTTISFYDILTKGHDLNLLATYTSNENIVQVLRSENYKIRFSIYAGIIRSNFIKGERRKEFLEQSNKIFHLFFNNFGLPLECSKKIFSYLSDEELKILINTY